MYLLRSIALQQAYNGSPVHLIKYVALSGIDLHHITSSRLRREGFCALQFTLKIIVCSVYGGWINEARVIPQKLLLTTCSGILIVINCALD